MVVPVWSVTERVSLSPLSLSLSLSLSLLFMHICAWQSADGRVTSDHCRVTFSDFFQKNFKLLETSIKRCSTVSNGRVTSDHCRVTFSDFFQNFSEMLETSKNVVWQSSNGRVTSDHCRVTFSDFFQKFSELLETSIKRCLTVIQRSRDLRPLSRDLQWLFQIFPNCLKRLKTLFDSHPPVAWPPTTVAWTSVTFSKIFRIAWNV